MLPLGRFFNIIRYLRTLQTLLFNFICFLGNTCHINQNFIQRTFIRFFGVLAGFTVIATGFIQFLFKQFNWFCVKYSFKYVDTSCVICLFHRGWNHETHRKMIRYVTFKNGSFKDSVIERACENMIYCSCRFSSNSSWFVYCWNHIMSIGYIEKLLHFPNCILVK